MLDAPETSLEHADVIRSKPLLRQFYSQAYSWFVSESPLISDGLTVEIGSGGGFLDEYIPDVVRMDLVPLPTIDLVSTATDLPFATASVKCLILLNVFHHIKCVGDFLSEAERCLKPGGEILMIEPANTLFSRFFYKNCHHEDFNPQKSDWSIDGEGRLSGANGALPWIVFRRDKEKFETLYPALKIRRYENVSPFRYLCSGGLSGYSLPSLLSGSIDVLENRLRFLNNFLGMFVRIVLEKS